MKIPFQVFHRRTLLSVALAGVVLSWAIVFASERAQGDSTVRPESIVAPSIVEQARPGVPVRLKIPKIHVDAAVESVGVTAQGAMDVPTDPADVAWFNLGPRPGENGSAVVDGHFGRWKNGAQTVFNSLHTLQRGDKILVEDEQGVTTTFVAREFRTYSLNKDAADVFRSDDGQAHLNLVTCEGVWDAARKSYSQRLVVFTDKE